MESDVFADDLSKNSEDNMDNRKRLGLVGKLAPKTLPADAPIAYQKVDVSVYEIFLVNSMKFP